MSVITAALLASLLSSAPTAAAPLQRVLLLQDRAQMSHEQAVVHEAMLQTLYNDPNVALVTPEVLPAALTRGAALRRAGCRELSEARRDLARRRTDDAVAGSSRAAQKLWRVARLTGEVAPWLEARAVQAAAQGSQGRIGTAEKLLFDVFAMDATFTDAALRRAGVRDAASRARAAVTSSRRVTLRLSATPLDAALWVDGQFVGYKDVSVQVVSGSQHVVLATAPGHSPRAQAVTTMHKRAEVDLLLVPAPAGATAPYDELVASTRLPDAFPDPNNPLFNAVEPSQVWVLRYADGGVHLAGFDLTTGRRHDVSAPATIFSLSDARDVAHALAVQPPPVPALVRPPTT